MSVTCSKLVQQKLTKQEQKKKSKEACDRRHKMSKLSMIVAVGSWEQGASLYYSMLVYVWKSHINYLTNTSSWHPTSVMLNQDRWEESPGLCILRKLLRWILCAFVFKNHWLRFKMAGSYLSLCGTTMLFKISRENLNFHDGNIHTSISEVNQSGESASQTEPHYRGSEINLIYLMK